VRIPSQGRALGEVAQKSIEDVRAKIAAGSGSELVNAEREEGKARVHHRLSLDMFVGCCFGVRSSMRDMRDVFRKCASARLLN
jgi:hypothetical protein